MFENWHWIYLWGILAVANYVFWIAKSLFDGPDRFRHGEIAKKATRQAMTVNQAKLVNANANTGEVTVSGKGVKFSARTAKATLAV